MRLSLATTLALPFLCICHEAFAVNLCTEALAKAGSVAIAKLMAINSHQKDCDDSTEPTPWVLEWSDDFNHEGALNGNKWEHEVGGGGFGNHELQAYTDRLQNARVEDGTLLIHAQKENYGDNSYTSARLNSKQSWTYGRIEVRAKFPRGRGTWAAAWLLPDKEDYGRKDWPDGGEIDFLENVGRDPNVNYASAHSAGFNFFAGRQRTSTTHVPDSANDFHTYTVDWLPDHMDFYVDGRKYMGFKKNPGDTWKEWPFDKDFHLIMNLAVGGGFAQGDGSPIDDSALPTNFEIQSVHVYRPADAAMCATQ